MIADRLRTKLFCALLLVYGGACAYFVLTPDYQWDYRMKYLSAEAYAKGVNPYDTTAVIKAAGDPDGLVYDYPPLTLKIFALFNGFDYASAARLYLVLKCAMLAVLLVIWRNLFFDGQTDIAFWLLCLLGFNATIFLDVRAGNISVFEQVGIWLAFYFYTRRNLLLFCALIVLVASFKLLPIAFLALLIFSEDRKKYAYLAGAAAAFGFIGWLSYTANPAYFRSFINIGVHTSAECGGIIDPSLGCFFVDISSNSGEILAYKLLGQLPLHWLAYAVAATAIVYAGLPSMMRTMRSQEREREKLLVYQACLVYALVCPRFKDYSYILLIPPAYYIMRRIARKSAGLGEFISNYGLANMRTSAVLLVILCITTGSSLPVLSMACRFFWDYFPLWSVCFLWWLYSLEFKNGRSGQSRAR
jgi:hypothetical protein